MHTLIVSRKHCVIPIAVAGVLFLGCGSTTVFKDLIRSSCLGSTLFQAAADAAGVEPEAFADVLRHLLLHENLEEGDWAGDFGDARLYAPAVLLGVGYEIDSPCLLEFGRASLEGNRQRIRDHRSRPLGFWADLPEQIMAAYGLVEAYAYGPGGEDLALIDAVLDRVDAAFELLGLYPEGLLESLSQPYGMTTQTAAIAALHLHYARQIGGERGRERREFGLRLIEAVNEHAYEPERGVYLFSTRTDRLHLYPNAMMIIANCMAYQAANDVAYLERAEATLQNIQPLKDAEQGNYRSPYSAATMGAESEDYSTLSSQLYLTFALCKLYETTGHEAYEAEARQVLGFVTSHLLEDGRLLHHWMDGRPAQPEDPEYYCTGCNFQALYVMWYLGGLQPSAASVL